MPCQVAGLHSFLGKDYENDENKSKIRFCLLSLGDKAYALSTKPNVYKKLNKEETERLKEHAKISKSERPSDLVLNLCDRGKTKTVSSNITELH